MQKEHKKAPHYIIAIGASAGGLEAIHEFFDNMPQNACLSFVVIQHLSPDYKSLLVELVSKHTHMKVFEAGHNMTVHKECVYIIPNNKVMTISRGKLKLADKSSEKAPNTAIDTFLFSLARDVEQNAVAVILSGTGTDGTRGIAAIKEAGGLVMVQDPLSAKFDGMPNSAIASGNVDFVLPPEMMPDEIYNAIHEVPVHTLNKGKISEQLLDEIYKLIYKSSGHDFQMYKTPTIIRRIGRRMLQGGFKTLDKYVEFLKTNPVETELLRQDFLINVTRFFRDEPAFRVLKEAVIPAIIDPKKDGDTVKVWVCACSSGEEAYSLAILIDQYQRLQHKQLEVKIFATDIDDKCINKAAKNSFETTIEKDVPPDILKTYFIKAGNAYSVIPRIRKQLVFARHNVIKDPPFIKNDLISCRNMLIYMNSVLQKKILNTFHFSLEDKGYLFLGTSETAGYVKEGLDEIDNKWKIYRKKPNFKLNPLDLYKGADQYGRINELRQAIAPRVKTSLSSQIADDFNQILFDDLGYAAVYIDPAFEIKESIGNYGKYLSLPEKKLSLNILHMLPRDLSVALSTAIRKATQTGEKVVLKSLRINDDEKGTFINISVKPANADEGKPFTLVIFNEFHAPEDLKTKEVQSYPGFFETGNPDYIVELEAELNETRLHLQMAVEGMETTNEELQSSNEELISSNEELQSSNEELQSLNEELHTLNTEHQLKIKELIELNDDLNNYFRSSDVGQIFIDSELRIRKFNPAAVKLINLIESDEGRPISHISTNLQYKGLMEDIFQVMSRDRIVEREVALNNGKLSLMRILPYLKLDGKPDGVIITFIDITDLNNLNNILKGTFNASLSAIIALKARRNSQNKLVDFTCITFNHAASRFFELEPESGTDKTLTDLVPGLLNDGLLKKYEDVIMNDTQLHTELQFGDNYFEVVAVKMQDGLIITCTDITDKKHADEKLQKNYNDLLQAREKLKQLNSELENKVADRTSKLFESDERFRLVSKATNDAIWDWDLDNNQMWISETFARMFGYKHSSEPLDRAFWISKIHPEDKERVLESQNDFIKEGKTQWSAEYRLLTAQGRYASILDRGYILSNESGIPYRMLGSMFDMTRIKEADEEIREKDRRFLSLVNVIPQMVWITDAQGRDEYFNQVFVDYSGHSVEELKELHHALVHPDDAAACRQAWDEAVKTENEFECEHRIKRADGEYRWHLSRALPQRNSEGHVSMWVGTNTDIQDQKIIQENLKISEDHFRTVADNTPFMIWKVDQEGLCNYVNKQWIEFTGLSFEKSLGLGWGAVLHPEDQNLEYEKFMQAFNHRLPYQSKFRIKRSDGQYRWVLALSNPMSQDEQTGYIGSLTDITVQELSQQATKILMRKKDEFMSIASHELKTPITSMNASLQIVRNLTADNSNPHVSMFIEKANRQAKKLTGLVDDLLDVTKLHAGKMQFNKSWFKIAEAIEDCTDQLSNNNTTHSINIVGDTSIRVYADKHRLEQVISNLLSNAIKYSPGAEKVNITLKPHHEHLKVEITDFGIGIADDKLEYVFDRFFRVQDSSQKFSGLGLGLYISAEIIERHNGQIGVESQLGKGSTFWFTLPFNAFEPENMPLKPDSETLL